jgi:hypothetical protein
MTEERTPELEEAEEAIEGADDPLPEDVRDGDVSEGGTNVGNDPEEEG